MDSFCSKDFVLTPNKLVLLLKIRHVYMMDSFYKNGFRSRNDLGAQITNSYDPSNTVKNFINELMAIEVLYLQGSLKLNVDKCDSLIADNKDFLLMWEFARDKAVLITDPFKK